MTDLQDLGSEIGCPPGIKTADYIRHLAKENERLKQYLSAEREVNRQLAAERDRMRKALEEILKADRSRAKFEHYGTCGQIANAALNTGASWFDAKAWHEK